MLSSSATDRSCKPLVRRRAMTLLEVVVAAGLLTALMAVTVQMIRVASGQQRAAERHAIALQTLQAIAEQIGNTPWEQITPAALSQIKIPMQVVAQLPGSALSIDLAEEAEPVAKRVSIVVSWNAPNGRPAGPVQLTAWEFPDVK